MTPPKYLTTVQCCLVYLITVAISEKGCAAASMSHAARAEVLMRNVITRVLSPECCTAVESLDCAPTGD